MFNFHSISSPFGILHPLIDKRRGILGENMSIGDRLKDSGKYPTVLRGNNTIQVRITKINNQMGCQKRTAANNFLMLAKDKNSNKSQKD